MKTKTIDIEAVNRELFLNGERFKLAGANTMESYHYGGNNSIYVTSAGQTTYKSAMLGHSDETALFYTMFFNQLVQVEIQFKDMIFAA